MGTRTGREDNEDFYEIDVPAYQRSTGVRTVQPLFVLPPQEVAEEEIFRVGAGTMETMLANRIANQELPKAYFEHAVVRAAPPNIPVYPYTLFVDGVKFSRTDNVIGVWLTSITTGDRSLLAVYRKSELCACGCRGWCSIFCIMLFLDWGFTALATGKHPAVRHDGSPFRNNESARAAFAGAQLGFRGVLIHIQCDMMEYPATFGYPSWASTVSPCPLCWCTHDDWDETVGLGAASLPWDIKTFADYKEACKECETWVVLSTAPLLRKVLGTLFFSTNPAMGTGGGAYGLISQSCLYKKETGSNPILACLTSANWIQQFQGQNFECCSGGAPMKP